ncbi:acyl-CoA/acyl-ACP dehydrogenase [Roseomonas sp. GC11]|uniref:acyl-CoA dehydrogenase family protein n=1 Tax=Roseomonas sp. GC11 TaxID=2950546 RepID=UPI00210BC283|nr:acyl-CoA dehydrogenase family protein [Roseomonas sp. GC11]MCQ4160097.1 acyl-CoA/acyl-ACP dehydrogenase [Roseomonas sp. GC11]
MSGALLLHQDPIQALVHHFAEGAAAHDRAGSFPHENFSRLHEAGLLGLTVPLAWGGEEAGLARCAALVGRIAEGCPATALVLAMQFIQSRLVTRDAAWPEAVRARLALGAVERGELINALRVEPELGSPVRGGLPATILRRTEAGWSLSGRKIYSTGAPGLRWFLVWARTEEEMPRVGSVLVDARSPGIRIEESWDQAGLRASGSHDVVLENVPVPAENAPDLRPPSGWAKPDADQTAWNTLLIAALYTGVARAARNWLLGFLHRRVPSGLGAPLATLPRMQEAVGRIEALLLANERLIAAAAAAQDAGTPPAATESALLKTLAAENAITVVQDAVALCGNHALARSNPLERHLRDVLCARIHTPQPDAAYVQAGRRALGLG